MQQRTLQLLVLMGVLVAAAGLGVGLTSNIDTGYDNPAPISDGFPFGAPNGFYVTYYGDTNAGLEQFNDGPDTLVIQADTGNITAQADGVADVTVYGTNVTGPWTNTTDISASLNAITLDPEDKPSAVVGGDIERLSYRQPAAVGADDGTVDFYYGGSSGTSRVTIPGAPANRELGAVDASTGELLGVATSDGSGRVTFDALENSNHSVLLQTSAGGPTVSNPSPVADLDQDPTELTIDVDDPDFDSDEVNVTFVLDGSKIHEENITAAQEVSAAIPASGKTGGSHTWTVIATDGYGNQRAESYTYRTPSELYIRNETNPSELVATPTTVDVQFFGDSQVYTRSTTDGTVNLTGLPINQNFIVTAEASGQGYGSRTVYIQSIYQQQNVYLLNNTAYSNITSRFQLDDPTGQFGADSVLFIEKPINESGTVAYRTVHADEFGAEGVTAELQQGQRYRLRVRSESGVTQVVGPYRSEVSETVTVRPGTPQIDIGNMTNGWGTAAELDNRTLTYRYSDPSGETDQLTVSIYRRGDPERLLVANETYFDLGNTSQVITLNESESKQVWIVRFEATRNGETVTKSQTVQNRPDFLPNLATEWRLISGILLLLLSAGAFSLLNARVGVMVVSIEGGLLWWVGWLEGATTGALVVMSLMIAVLVNIYASR